MCDVCKSTNTSYFACHIQFNCHIMFVLSENESIVYGIETVNKRIESRKQPEQMPQTNKLNHFSYGPVLITEDWLQS